MNNKLLNDRSLKTKSTSQRPQYEGSQETTLTDVVERLELEAL